MITFFGSWTSFAHRIQFHLLVHASLENDKTVNIELRMSRWKGPLESSHYLVLPQESAIWLRFRNSSSILRIWVLASTFYVAVLVHNYSRAWAIEMPILCPQDLVGKEFLRSSSPLFTANIFLGMTVVCCSKEEPDNLPLTLEYSRVTMHTTGYFGIKKCNSVWKILISILENHEGFDKYCQFWAENSK